MFEILYPTFKIDKKVRLIELFAGVGSQAMALRNIGADFEHHKVIEFDKFAIASYNAIHGTDFETTDITEITGKDLSITDTTIYIYANILISLFHRRHLSDYQQRVKGNKTH